MTAFDGLVASLFGLALVAVLVSGNTTVSQSLQAFFKMLSGMIQTIMKPVQGQ
jgi:hypothetical protein